MTFGGSRRLVTSLKQSRRPSSTPTLPLAITRESEAGECPICMDSYSFPVATNCGHLFCARCFCLHWQRTFYSRQINCPMCRGHVSSLSLNSTAIQIYSPHFCSTASLVCIEIVSWTFMIECTP
ncbi:unnamed protein product [Dicrocoelium dendriticum]|nr:unnamed protein product [Dicrocoelium dendriticum]CAI2736884.1 unnamed protein product [Dicrocoelium dendriticum]